MRETLVTLLTVCAAGACADNVMSAAEDGGRNIGRYVRLVFTLVVISTVFLPAISRGKSMAENMYVPCEPTAASEDVNFSSQDLVREECRRELERKISEALWEKFGIKDTTVRIELTEEKSGDTITLSITSVSAELDEEHTSDAETVTEEVTAYVRELTGCDSVCVSKKIGREGESH